jgi:uncharacterized protein (TIGR03435 family)
MPVFCRVAAAVILNVVCLPAVAQPAAFEVASVKPNPSQDFRTMSMKSLPGGRFTATDLPVRMLISVAYNLPMNPTERLAAAPDWTLADRFDIEAKAPAGAFPPGMAASAARARMLAMIRSLLADRFQLVMHHETRDLPVYVLTVAKGGPRLAPATLEEKDCPPGPSDGLTCHNFNGGIGRGLHAKAVTMKDLAGYIENWTDLPVIDQTGLDGMFAIETEGWTPMRLPPPPPPGASVNPAPRPSGDGDMTDPTRPTLFNVLQKLGLDLKRQKGPVDVYTVEHIEHPAAN